MKIRILLIVAIIVCVKTYPQTYTAQHQNYIEPILINPAVAGADIVPKATISYNKQYLNISHAPSNLFLSGQMRLGRYDFYNPEKFINQSKFKSFERVGLAAGLYADINGPFREYNMLFTYSYHLPISNTTQLSFGITGKVDHFGVNDTELEPRDHDDPLIHFESATGINANTGIYLYNERYFGGISAVNLFKPLTNNFYEINSNPVLYALAGYRFISEDHSFILEPMATYGYDVVIDEHRIDIHSRFYINDYGWLSVSYKNLNAFGLIVAVHIYESIYLGYNYSSGPGEIGVYRNGSHGIMLGKNLGVSHFTNPD